MSQTRFHTLKATIIFSLAWGISALGTKKYLHVPLKWVIPNENWTKIDWIRAKNKTSYFQGFEMLKSVHWNQSYCEISMYDSCFVQYTADLSSPLEKSCMCVNPALVMLGLGDPKKESNSPNTLNFHFCDPKPLCKFFFYPSWCFPAKKTFLVFKAKCNFLQFVGPPRPNMTKVFIFLTWLK